ncbi:MAG TPA: methyltransferase domain-containing protein [Kofleriaceae bacterium]|nr:methyltransferase domain-containing protein [Kofleriaceae bacterium]
MRLRQAWHRWVALLDRREAPTSLALTRILVAAVILGDLLQARLHGVVAAVWAPPPYGIGVGAVWDAEPPWSIRWFGASVDTAELLWWVAVIAAALLLLGAASRLAAILLVLVLAQMAHIAPDGDRGIDLLLRAVLPVLALSLSHARWSVDAWVRRRIGRPYPPLVPAWPRTLLFAQLVWVYFSAGHNKSDEAWGPLGGFTALASIMCDPHFARFDCAWVSPFSPLLRVATLATMAFELSAPLLPLFTWWEATRDRPGRLRRLSNRLRLRWVWIALGVVFHLGIAMTLKLGIFPWGMLALYPVLFAPACATPRAQPEPAPEHEHEHDHAHAGGMPHRFEHADDWAPMFDDPTRDAWQKPDEVITVVGVAPGMTVVDVGAGTGYFLARLSAAVGPAGKVIATDIEPDMVRYMVERAAREKLLNVEVLLAPADSVGVPDASADRILIVDTWHHIGSRETYAAGLRRALRPGGAVAVVDFTLESERGPPPAHRLAPARVMEELRAGGLVPAQATETLPDQYIVTAGSPDPASSPAGTP